MEAELRELILPRMYYLNSTGVTDKSSAVVADVPYDLGPEDCEGNNMGDEHPSVSVASPRCSQWQRQEPDRHNAVRSV